ncbi:MAG: hypothetical protein ACYC9K_01175 [Sulfuricaulis sp.]
MTDTEHPVVKALDEIANGYRYSTTYGSTMMAHGSVAQAKMAAEALPLARELVEASDALDWLLKIFPGFVKNSLTQVDFPPEFSGYLKQRIEKLREGKA